MTSSPISNGKLLPSGKFTSMHETTPHRTAVQEMAGNWLTPRELPDLRRVGIVALDTETRDAGPHARGSSWPLGRGCVAASERRRNASPLAYVRCAARHAMSIPIALRCAEELERAGDDRAKAVTALTHRLLADETLRQALVEPIIRNIAAGSIATVVHHRRGAE